MKFQHKTNLLLSLASGVVAAGINYYQFGSILAAVLGAGPFTFVMGLAFNYGIDVVRHLWLSRKKAS